ncbi:hypothetical protein VULLAG_LOCUS1929 [Vulpes lagopus]
MHIPEFLTSNSWAVALCDWHLTTNHKSPAVDTEKCGPIPWVKASVSSSGEWDQRTHRRTPARLLQDRPWRQRQGADGQQLHRKGSKVQTIWKEGKATTLLGVACSRRPDEVAGTSDLRHASALSSVPLSSCPSPRLALSLRTQTLQHLYPLSASAPEHQSTDVSFNVSSPSVVYTGGLVQVCRGAPAGAGG